MSPSHRSLGCIVGLVAVPLFTACGTAPADAGGAGSNDSAETSPVSCPSGTVHPRVCTLPLTSGPSAGEYAIDVDNDVNAACPDGYSLAKESTEADGICCVVPSATDITECAQPWSSDPSVSSEVWTFPATQCAAAADAGVSSWAAAPPHQ